MLAMRRPSEAERPNAATASGASQPSDRASELRERLARARAEQTVIESELARVDPTETARTESHERD